MIIDIILAACMIHTIRVPAPDPILHLLDLGCKTLATMNKDKSPSEIFYIYFKNKDETYYVETRLKRDRRGEKLKIILYRLEHACECPIPGHSRIHII